MDLNLSALDRLLTDAGHKAWDEALAPMMDLTILLEPDRWRTWSEETMYEPLFAQGYTEDEVAAWWHPTDH